MAEVNMDTLIDQVGSKYALVQIAARRARQVNDYYHNLGEGSFEEFPPPLIESHSKNYLTLALEEIAAGKIKFEYSEETGT